LLNDFFKECTILLDPEKIFKLITFAVLVASLILQISYVVGFDTWVESELPPQVLHDGVGLGELELEKYEIRFLLVILD